MTIVDSTIALPVVIPADEPRRRTPAFWPVVAFVVLGALVAVGVWALGERSGPPALDVPATAVVTVPSTTTPRPTVAPTVAPTVVVVPATVGATRTPTTKAPKVEKAPKAPKPKKTAPDKIDER